MSGQLYNWAFPALTSTAELEEPWPSSRILCYAEYDTIELVSYIHLLLRPVVCHYCSQGSDSKTKVAVNTAFCFCALWDFISGRWRGMDKADRGACCTNLATKVWSLQPRSQKLSFDFPIRSIVYAHIHTCTYTHNNNNSSNKYDICILDFSPVFKSKVLAAEVVKVHSKYGLLWQMLVRADPGLFGLYCI